MMCCSVGFRFEVSIDAAATCDVNGSLVLAWNIYLLDFHASFTASYAHVPITRTVSVHPTRGFSTCRSIIWKNPKTTRIVPVSVFISFLCFGSRWLLRSNAKQFWPYFLGFCRVFTKSLSSSYSTWNPKAMSVLVRLVWSCDSVLVICLWVLRHLVTMSNWSGKSVSISAPQLQTSLIM